MGLESHPTQEAEAGESLEPWSWRLQWAKITPLHSSLDNRARLHLKNNNNKAITKRQILYDSTYSMKYLK